ncbi:MAG: amidohydrolase family protein [Gammaproteobacteria bacterium]
MELRRTGPRRKVLRAIVALVLFTHGVSHGQLVLAADEASATAFVDVNVVPMDSERELMHQTVVVRDGLIEAIGPVANVSVPPDAQRIDGGGSRYLLPGLADMHTHLTSGEDAALYLASGVTTVLQMGGDGRIESIPFLRGLLRDAPSPQVFFALMVDGPEPQAGGWPLHSIDEARFAVKAAKDRQYDFIKVYNGLSAEQFDAVVDEAKAQGLAVIGHGVRSVGLPEGLFRGQVMVAHAEEFYYTVFGNQPQPEERMIQVADDVARSGAYVTPNLSFQDAIVRQWGHPDVRAQMFADPRVAYLNPLTRLRWTAPRRDYSQFAGNPMSPQLAFLKQFTLALANAGVPLLAGTDTPLIPGLLPGSGLVDEILMLEEAGLSNYQALASATRTPGEFVAKHVANAPTFGTVAPGARADLLLVEVNPLQSLDTLREPVGVMVGGTWRTAEELAVIIEQNRQAMESSLREAFGR